MKQLRIVIGLAMCMGLTMFISCEPEEEVNPVTSAVTTQVTADLIYNVGFWYIDTAYSDANSTQNLMLLSNIQNCRVSFKTYQGDTTWSETSTVLNFQDNHYLYRTEGDTTYWEPQLATDSYQAMIIDSLTESILHFRVVNYSPPPYADPADFTHSSLKYYEYSR